MIHHARLYSIYIIFVHIIFIMNFKYYLNELINIPIIDPKVYSDEPDSNT